MLLLVYALVLGLLVLSILKTRQGFEIHESFNTNASMHVYKSTDNYFKVYPTGTRSKPPVVTPAPAPAASQCLSSTPTTPPAARGNAPMP